MPLPRHQLQRSDTTASTPQHSSSHGRPGGLPTRRLSLQPNVTIPKIRRSPSPKKSPKAVYKVLILGATKVCHFIASPSFYDPLLIYPLRTIETDVEIVTSALAGL